MGPQTLALASMLLASVAFARRPVLQASASATDVLLTRTALVVIKVHFEGDVSTVRALAKVGTLSPFEQISEHDARMIWTPPSTHFPQVEQILLWNPESTDAPDVSVVRLRLLGRTDLDINTEPGATVQVDVAGKMFGPRRADPKGHVTVPIDVPPGVHSARVLGQSRTTSSAVDIPIDVPQTNPLAGLFGPDLIRPGAQAWLWIFHETRLPSGALGLAVQGGAWTQVRTEADRALFQIQLSPAATRVDVQVVLQGSQQGKLSFGQDAVPEPPKPPPPPILITHSSSIVPGIQVGGFYAGGANLGPALAVVLGRRLPGLGNRVAGEVELGFREASLTTEVPGLGEIDSRVDAIPVAVAARARLFEWGAWSVDARAGVGLLFFDHQTHSAFQPSYGETGIGADLFAAVLATYRLPAFEMFVEARGAFSPVHTPRLDAQLGGLALSVGARIPR